MYSKKTKTYPLKLSKLLGGGRGAELYTEQQKVIPQIATHPGIEGIQIRTRLFFTHQLINSDTSGKIQ